MGTQIETIRKYFNLLERFETDHSKFIAWVHEDFRQREFPNTLNTKGQESDLADALRRAAVGKKMLASQSYEITNHFERGEQLVVEVVWRGRMAMDAGILKAGQELKAFFCIVSEFKDGRIHRQRNYDCFEAFS